MPRDSPLLSFMEDFVPLHFVPFGLVPQQLATRESPFSQQHAGACIEAVGGHVSCTAVCMNDCVKLHVFVGTMCRRISI